MHHAIVSENNNNPHLNPNAEQMLIGGCLKNDRTCQKELYRLHFGYALSICIRYAENRDEALEIVNDGFMKVFNKLKQYHTEMPFKPWLGRIMVNTAIDYHRKNLKRKTMEDIDAGKEVQDGENILSKIGYQDLIKLVQKLSTAYRTVFNLFVIDGYSHEEIAGMLSITEGTSRSNLFKAREQLRDMLKKLDAEKQAIL